MGVYLERISSSDYRVYQPLEYQGAQPNLPLWVGHVIRSGVVNKDPLTADTYPKMIGDVLGWLTPYFLSFIDDKDIQVFAHTAWSLFHTDGSSAINDGVKIWASGTTTAGSDDGETTTQSVTSHTFVRTKSGTNSLNAYAEKEFTTTAPESIVDFAQYFSTPGNGTGNTRYQLWRKDGGIYYEMPLNGRGLLRHRNYDDASDSYGPGSLNVRVWDNKGVLDWYRSTSYLMDTDGQNHVEAARHLPPGTYRLRVTKVGNNTDQIMVGRLRIRTMHTAVTPISSGAKKYFREIAHKKSSTKGYQPPGAYGVSWLSSQDIEIKESGGSQYENGPNYGYNRQTGALFDGDGNTLSPTDGQILGPFTQLTFSTVDEQCKQPPTVSGTAAALVNGTKTINLTTDGPTLTADMVGDYIELLGRTDGLDGGAWFPIEAIDDSTKIVTVTADANFTTATGITWRIHSNYGQFTKEYVFTDQGMRLNCTFTLRKDTTISRLFTGDYRPSTRGQDPTNNDNWFDYMPEHTRGVHPYACTGIRSKSTRFSVDQGYFPLGTGAVYINVPNTSIVEAYTDYATMDGTGLPTEHKAFFYDDIECGHLRSVQRVVQVEIDPLNWTGSNYYTGGILSFHSQTDKCKSYNTVVMDTAYVTNDNIIFGFTMRFLEPIKYTAEQSSLSLGGGGSGGGLSIKGGNMDTFPVTLTASPQSLATLTGLPADVPIKGVILQTTGTINFGNASQPFTLSNNMIQLPVTDLKALKLVGSGVVVNIGIIR